jgi:hypothetical protein
MSSLHRLRGESPQKREGPPKSPTSSPELARPPDSTITSTIPFLRAIYDTPAGQHNTASFLRECFTEYLRLQHDIASTSDDDVDNTERITLQKMKDMIALTKTIRGYAGHETARVHIVEYEPSNLECVRKFWSLVVPVYRIPGSDASSQRPTLNLANITLLENDKRAADALPPEEYERMLLILISHIFRILGSDCVPVVMNPVVTDHLRKYLEPVTRLGKFDTIEFPPEIEGDARPRFRLLGLSNRDVRRRGWMRDGEFGWAHVQDVEINAEGNRGVNGESSEELQKS